MGEWLWGAVACAIALVIAGGITWWLAKGCIVTRIGAVGAIVGALVALGLLVFLLDYDTGMRVAYIVSGGSGVWLLAWALAGGIRGQRLARAEAVAATTASVPTHTGSVPVAAGGSWHS